MDKQLENAHWRDSARSIRFFVWDAKAVLPFAIFIVHMRWWTFIFAVVTMTFFSILNRYGFKPVVFVRWLRNKLAGSHKTAIAWWMK